MLYYKALHIIFIVTWFAGLFYIVRLFIYHVEANQKDEPEKSILTKQFQLMEKRLWFGITWPSMILATLFGSLLIYEAPNFLKMPYMHVKLGFVALLIIYHFSCHTIYNQLKNGACKLTSTKLRIWNEVATLFLVSIIFLIVLKNTIDFIWGTAGIIILSAGLMLAIKLYKKFRQK